MALASAAGFLELSGYQPTLLDISRSTQAEWLQDPAIGKAPFVGISVPMHTALRLGLQVAQQIRAINKNCHINFFGLYAHLNAHYLLERAADSVIGGECEGPLLALIQALEQGDSLDAIDGVSTRHHPAK